MSQYETCDKVIIDEGHFFEDLFESVLIMAHKHKKDVLVGGLYADYMAVPFVQMTKLIAHACEVRFLKAKCKLCDLEDNMAIYTKMIENVPTKKLPKAYGSPEVCETRIIVGGSEKFTPVCLKHFLG
jgi:thymidine kinase